MYILPAISLMSYSMFGLVPMLGLIRWAKTFENATDYSLQNTVRQALFLPTSREAKYKAKAAIDTFFMRFGDVLQAGMVRLGAQFHLALYRLRLDQCRPDAGLALHRHATGARTSADGLLSGAGIHQARSRYTSSKLMVLQELQRQTAQHPIVAMQRPEGHLQRFGR